jgi:arabinose-5-phosphate isomerase
VPATPRPESDQPDRPGTASLDLARRVLRIEAEAVRSLADRLDARFEAALTLLLECVGRVIVTGMGKSGIIARKLAATLSSTGTPAYFIHPAEAVHGDLGAIQPSDVVIGLSHSGETPELLRLLETIRRLDVRLIALTGASDSALAEAADVTLDCGVHMEACPLNLVPTASTTAALALGDALAMALLVGKGFREDDFAHLHPGGQLGKRLLRVERLMHTGAEIPTVTPPAAINQVIATISAGGFGMTCVVGGDGHIVGIITDGDLRRHLAGPTGLAGKTARDLMTAGPVTIGPGALAIDALNRMERRRITSLLVADEERRLLGLVHLHDLWRTELF